MNKKKFAVSLIALMLWMALIFWFSSKGVTESKSQSEGILSMVKKLFEQIIPASCFANTASQALWEHLIRKAAHFTLYLVLGILSYNTFRHFGKLRYKLLISLLFCVIYAASDEFHQSFVPGRGPLVTDVLLDSCGSLTGILIFMGIPKLRSKKTTQ